MAISNLTQGLRPGICTSTTRPTAPYEGQMIYETNTDKVLVWNGSAWSYSLTPQTLEPGASQSYTPVWTSLTVGNGTVVATYTRINNFVHYEGKLTFGSTTSITGSSPQLSLPVTAAQSFQQIGNVVYADSGVATYSGFPLQIGTTTIYLFIQNFATSYGSEVAVTSTVPFTWGTNDSITWSFNYMAA